MQTLYPRLDDEVEVTTICDSSGNVLGVNKSSWDIYEYTYNFTLQEERYNILKFSSGNAALVLSLIHI